jgi:hypothetical protein
MRLARNGIEDYLNYLERWAKIENKTEQPILQLLWWPQIKFDKSVYDFSHWKQESSARLDQVRSSLTLSSPTTSEKNPTPQSNDIHRYIVDGLTKAREDLPQIKKESLSCETINAWQTRADTATRLAHANGISIHNPISQHLSACQNVTDVELLDVIRSNIVQLLNKGIQSAKS